MESDLVGARFELRRWLPQASLDVSLERARPRSGRRVAMVVGAKLCEGSISYHLGHLGQPPSGGFWWPRSGVFWDRAGVKDCCKIKCTLCWGFIKRSWMMDHRSVWWSCAILGDARSGMGTGPTSPLMARAPPSGRRIPSWKQSSSPKAKARTMASFSCLGKTTASGLRMWKWAYWRVTHLNLMTIRMGERLWRINQRRQNRQNANMRHMPESSEGQWPTVSAEAEGHIFQEAESLPARIAASAFHFLRSS